MKLIDKIIKRILDKYYSNQVMKSIVNEARCMYNLDVTYEIKKEVTIYWNYNDKERRLKYKKQFFSFNIEKGLYILTHDEMLNEIMNRLKNEVKQNTIK